MVLGFDRGHLRLIIFSHRSERRTSSSSYTLVLRHPALKVLRRMSDYMPVCKSLTLQTDSSHVAQRHWMSDNDIVTGGHRKAEHDSRAGCCARASCKETCKMSGRFRRTKRDSAVADMVHVTTAFAPSQRLGDRECLHHLAPHASSQRRFRERGPAKEARLATLYDLGGVQGSPSPVEIRCSKVGCQK